MRNGRGSLNSGKGVSAVRGGQRAFSSKPLISFLGTVDPSAGTLKTAFVFAPGVISGRTITRSCSQKLSESILASLDTLLSKTEPRPLKSGHSKKCKNS